ncbi:MAG: helix-turn-helix domain-containing protein [Gordonia sp. (in: high G+C Gram-positive bacteria)]|uniref:helix-turn-helix domain-containing protein n=1 Tax=Gordonia sp. (in: high G+C Gram-positive bacteria) TaxID=84139 RepID=UPI0039E5376C
MTLSPHRIDAVDPDLQATLAVASVEHPIRHYLGLPGAPTRSTVICAIRNGELAAHFVGREYRIAERDFAAWIDSRRIAADEADVAPHNRRRHRRHDRNALDPRTRDWLDEVLADAPPIPAEQAGAVARLIIAGGAAS